MDKTTETYELQELVALNIDSWVEAIGALNGIDAVRNEAYEISEETYDKENPLCPAELEVAYTELAKKYNFRFDKDGKIVSGNPPDNKGEPKNKAKFVKIERKATFEDDPRNYDWVDWFCLGETWTHPYNRGNALAAEFQQWCKEQEAKGKRFDSPYSSVCPEVTIEGNPLHDGWGSDVVYRMTIDLKKGAEDAVAYVIEKALKTGEKQSVHLENGRVKIDFVITPYNTVTPDPASIKEFGPYAAAAMEGLKAA